MDGFCFIALRVFFRSCRFFVSALFYWGVFAACDVGIADRQRIHVGGVP